VVSHIEDGYMAGDEIFPPAAREPDFLESCQERLEYRFSDEKLLRRALRHASSAEHRLASNERLEFLGDAILGYVVCEILFEEYPDYLEGELTRIKSVIVSRQTCAKISQRLHLEDFIIVGKGMISQPNLPISLLANVLESVIAAIYLDGGMEAARAFLKRQVMAEIEEVVSHRMGHNYKSQLQQIAQRELNRTPTYQLLDEKGPDHSKCFKVSARVGDTKYPPAWGSNKKEAEQRAARNALSEIQGEDSPFPSDE